MASNTEQSGFAYAVDDGVAVITMDQPGEPVNTLSPESGAAFGQLLERAEADPAVVAVVFTSGKKDSFIAGAKIDWLSTLTTSEAAVAAAKEAHRGFERIEKAKKPVLVAINGVCLGGGLEWALACAYRLSSDSPKVSIGLPEVQLGLLPGGGGTQRLPRLIGAQAALDLILGSKSVKPAKARKLGIVDEVVPAPILLTVAKTRARELASGKLKMERDRGMTGAAKSAKGFGGILKGLTNMGNWTELALEDNPVGRKVLFDQARKQVMKKTRGKYPAPLRALEAIRVGLDKGMEAGLEAEARGFGELVVSPESKRLVEIFFATTALKKDNGTSNPEVKPRPVNKIGVLGGGLMGGGIAFVSAVNEGVPVRIKERDDAGAGRALKHVQGLLDEKVKRRSLSSREASSKMAMVTAGTSWAGFSNVDVVIEAVFEDMDLKHRMIREVEAVTRKDCIFASNTSSLPITQLAEASAHPETIIGMHYFSPVQKMPLLEIITHKGTADWVTATCVEIGKKQGKTVIVVNDGVGFYTSRILAPYMNEAAYLLAEGADIAELDKALVEFGFPVGPITLLDEVGIDVAAKVAKIMHGAFGLRMAPPDVLKKVIDDNRQGRKNRRGFYSYEGKKKKEVDASVYELLPGGKNRKQLDRQEMAERCALQFVNEAYLCLGENILRSPRDGDIGAIFGLGFPPFLGGPFRYADSVGANTLLERMEHWRAKFGERFTPAPALVEAAKSGRKFYP